jgi:PTH1 family peptidyl-tRNA hydrolase
MKLVVGLGNPGERYRSTPHNVGFAVVEELAFRGTMEWRDSRRVKAVVAEGVLAGERCLLVKPTTFMNLSGDAVGPLVRYFGVEVGDGLMAVYDDVALGFGVLRLRADGSSGGHRGVSSLIAHLGTQQFTRLRFGIAPSSGVVDGDLSDYVLARWPKSLQSELQAGVGRAADAVEEWIKNGITAVMNKFNTRNRTQAEEA